jgi:hypothetical protein
LKALYPLLLATACAHGGALGAVSRADSPRVVRAGGAVFELEYEPEDLEAARDVAASLERAALVAQRWGTLGAPVRITIHPTHERLESASHHLGYGWLRAFARSSALELQSPRTWTGGRASSEQLVTLLTHELTHCVMYQAGFSPRAARDRRIPLWFREGMASVTAGEAAAVEPVAAVALDPRESEDSRQADLQYEAAAQAFSHLLHRYGEARIRGVLERLSEGLGFAEAFEKSIGVPLVAFEADLSQGRASLGSRPAAPSSSPEVLVTPAPTSTSASALPSAASGRNGFVKPPRSSDSRV